LATKTVDASACSLM